MEELDAIRQAEEAALLEAEAAVAEATAEATAGLFDFDSDDDEESEDDSKAESKITSSSKTLSTHASPQEKISGNDNDESILQGSQNGSVSSANGLIIDTPLKLNGNQSITNYSIDKLHNGNGITNQPVSNGGYLSPNIKVNLSNDFYKWLIYFLYYRKLCY